MAVAQVQTCQDIGLWQGEEDRVTLYADFVISGSIVAGPLVRLAAKRHLDDLDRSDRDSGAPFFDLDAANHAIDFFSEFLVLEDGEPFHLQLWECFIIGSIFGWKNADGTRRFRTSYIEIGKGNGKTPLAAGAALYVLAVDSENDPAAQIFAAATTREQASLCFNDARAMARRSPEIANALRIREYQLDNPPTESFFRAVSAEHRGLDGKRVHFAIVDELHEHPNGAVVAKIRLGTKNRVNGHILEITNSGFDTESVCFEHHQYSERILKGEVPAEEAESWFCYVCGLDKKDDWRNPAVWIKANPNLGVSVPVRYLHELVQQAKEMPSDEYMVRRLNFCEWTQSVEKWLDPADWQRGALPGWRVLRQRFLGEPCYAGIDLSSVRDVTALTLIFVTEKDEVQHFSSLHWFWIPEAAVPAHVGKRARFDLWAKSGEVRTTPGNVIDYKVVLEDVKEIFLQYDIQEVAYDPWNATSFVLELQQEGYQVVAVRQGYASLNEPSKFFERSIVSGTWHHGGMRIMRWMAGNTMILRDPAGNIKPAKDKSVGKIDGISATVTALARIVALEVHEESEEPSSEEAAS